MPRPINPEDYRSSDELTEMKPLLMITYNHSTYSHINIKEKNNCLFMLYLPKHEQGEREMNLTWRSKT